MVGRARSHQGAVRCVLGHIKVIWSLYERCKIFHFYKISQEDVTKVLCIELINGIFLDSNV